MSSLISAVVRIGLFEVNEAAEIIAEAADPEANIIFAVIDEKLKEEIRSLLSLPVLINQR